MKSLDEEGNELGVPEDEAQTGASSGIPQDQLSQAPTEMLAREYNRLMSQYD